MNALPVVQPFSYTQRYEAWLRAVTALAICSDCDAAADALSKGLHEVIPFDYLHVVVLDKDTNAVEWSLLEAHDNRLEAAGVGFPPLEDTPIPWVHEHQELLITRDWGRESRFPKHRQFLSDLGIASTCTLPLVRGQRRLGVFSLCSSRTHSYAS